MLKYNIRELSRVYKVLRKPITKRHKSQNPLLNSAWAPDLFTSYPMKKFNFKFHKCKPITTQSKPGCRTRDYAQRAMWTSGSGITSDGFEQYDARAQALRCHLMDSTGDQSMSRIRKLVLLTMIGLSALVVLDHAQADKHLRSQSPEIDLPMQD